MFRLFFLGVRRQRWKRADASIFAVKIEPLLKIENESKVTPEKPENGINVIVNIQSKPKVSPSYPKCHYTLILLEKRTALLRATADYVNNEMQENDNLNRNRNRNLIRTRTRDLKRERTGLVIIEALCKISGTVGTFKTVRIGGVSQIYVIAVARPTLPKAKCNLVSTFLLCPSIVSVRSRSPITRPEARVKRELSNALKRTLKRTKEQETTFRIRLRVGVSGLREDVGLLLLRCGDVESNPGPNFSLKVISNNVRGLNSETKLRHLINFCNSNNPGKNKDVVFCFQETYIESKGILPYLWRGNFMLTPGTGNSCGCITLLSNHLNIVETKHLGNRGHVLACQRSGDQGITYIVANIYAPNPNTRAKIEFFDLIFEAVTELSDRFLCENVVVVGDYNLIFKKADAKNRNFSIQERRVAEIVNYKMNELNLKDVWERDSCFTWRRPNTEVMSCIDRCFYNPVLNSVVSKVTNWSLTFSDHAAIQIELASKVNPPKNRSYLVRLDPSVLSNTENRDKIKLELETLLLEVPAEWNPHTKLEFTKVCLRTVVEKVQADTRKKDKGEEDLINDELNLAIRSLERTNHSARNRERYNRIH